MLQYPLCRREIQCCLPPNLEDLYQAWRGQPLVSPGTQRSSIFRQLSARMRLLQEARELQSSLLITIKSTGKEQSRLVGLRAKYSLLPPPSVKCPSYSKTDLPCQMSLPVSIQNYLSSGLSTISIPDNRHDRTS